MARRERRSGQTLILIGGRDFEADLTELEARTVPRREDEPAPGADPPADRIESIFWSSRDVLGVERHGARTLRNPLSGL